MYTRNNRGSVLAEYLLTLLIVLSLIPITLMSLSIISTTLKHDETIQDTIANYQLRRMLALSYDAYLEDDTLYFTSQNEERRLSLKNNKLIIQPGTQIVYVDIDDAYFIEEGNTFYLTYTRGDRTYETAILSK